MFYNLFFRFKYRCDPVPFTRRKRGGRWYRRPGTTYERRWSEADREYVRPKRNKCNLVNAMDDFQRSDLKNLRSWKKLKKKYQWE